MTSTANEIMNALRAAGRPLSDQDLAHRLDKPEASIRRTRRMLHEARLVAFAGLDVSANQQTWQVWA